MDGKTYQRWKILSAGFLVFIYMPVFLAIDEVSQIVFRGNANHTLTVISLLIDVFVPLFVADAANRYFLDGHKNRNLSWIVFSVAYCFGLLMLTNTLKAYPVMLCGFYGLLITFIKRYGFNGKQQFMASFIAVETIVGLKYFTEIITMYGIVLVVSIVLMILFYETEFKVNRESKRKRRTFTVDKIGKMLLYELLFIALSYCLLLAFPLLFIKSTAYRAYMNVLISMPIFIVVLVILIFSPKIEAKLKKYMKPKTRTPKTETIQEAKSESSQSKEQKIEPIDEQNNEPEKETEDSENN